MAMQVGNADSNFTEPMADINTTPLIDVMLVLLIMVILTVPAQNHVLNFNVPVASPTATQPSDVVRIDVTGDGAVLWNGEKLPDRAALEARFRSIAAAPVPPEIHLWTDSNATYGQMAMVMAAAQRQQLKKFAIIGNERFIDQKAASSPR
jgi:biopolymer transport protein ExbD